MWSENEGAKWNVKCMREREREREREKVEWIAVE